LTVVLAATNRPDVLDRRCCAQALRRRVIVDRPSSARRRFSLHTRGKPLADDVELDVIACTRRASPAPIWRIW
jgi:transitional endoplasmic reticulum ATPase